MKEIQFGTGVKPKSAQIDAVVIRKDGTIEQLGTIAYYNRNPLMRLAWRVSKYLKELIHGRSL